MVMKIFGNKFPFDVSYVHDSKIHTIVVTPHSYSCLLRTSKNHDRS